MKLQENIQRIMEVMNINQYKDIQAYRGIGKRINATYGGNDDGIGIFWTDNMTMAKWFAGLIEYDVDTDQYETISEDGKVIEKTLNFNNPYVIATDDEDHDAFQQYMDEIKETGGVETYKSNLIDKGYDGIILEDNNTNYYEDGTYNIYIEF